MKDDKELSDELREKSLKIWKYLADDPRKSKGAAYLDLGLEVDAFNCPACTLDVLRTGVGDCLCCPLRGCWPEYYSDGYSDAVLFYCSGKGSAYCEWEAHLTDERRKIAAEKMSQLLKSIGT